MNLIILTGSAALVAVGIVIVLIWLLPLLAAEGILVCRVKEGTVKAILHGSSLHHFAMSFKGHHLNDPRSKKYDDEKPAWQIIYHGDDAGKDREYDTRFWLLRYLGLYWVGMPWRARVYVYEFQWNETRLNKDGNEEIYARDERTDFAYVSDFPYAFVTMANTNEMLTTQERTILTVAIENPYKALFGSENWMERTTSANNRYVREYVGKHKYEEVVAKTDEKHFCDVMLSLNDKMPGQDPDTGSKGLVERYGVRIKGADLQFVDLAGDAKKQHEEAATMHFTAEKKADATRLQGEAEAYVIEQKGEKEAQAIEKRITAITKNPDVGIALAGLDALQASGEKGNTIVWANNPLTVLKEFARSLKGGE